MAPVLSRYEQFEQLRIKATSSEQIEDILVLDSLKTWKTKVEGARANKKILALARLAVLTSN